MLHSDLDSQVKGREQTKMKTQSLFSLVTLLVTSSDRRDLLASTEISPRRCPAINTLLTQKYACARGGNGGVRVRRGSVSEGEGDEGARRARGLVRHRRTPAPRYEDGTAADIGDEKDNNACTQTPKGEKYITYRLERLGLDISC